MNKMSSAITKLKSIFSDGISLPMLVGGVTLFLVVFGNFVFCRNFFNIYKPSFFTIAAFLSLVISLFLITYNLVLILSFRCIAKLFLFLLLLVSASASYFMESYNIVINYEMIRNIIDTDVNESLDLVSVKLFVYIFCLGILPSIFVLKVKIRKVGALKLLITKLKTISVSLCFIAILLFSFSKFYTSFFREHKSLRLTINPLYWVYSSGVFVKKTFFTDMNQQFKNIALDASVANGAGKKKLVIMVVGEAVRADKMPFNGYKRNIMPLISKEQGIANFPEFYSCGTSTAVSVPCMFSSYDRGDYEYIKGKNTDNILDILARTGQVSVLWRDNNSSSKHVADRVNYQDFKNSNLNTICDVECRDIGMLVGLKDYISKQNDNNILIILHQMGNHGPAYYKRYPKEYEKFKPVCKTNQLENCTIEEINNAYDNSIIYTDYFLSEVIALLKSYSGKYQTAMIYMSDHGESLGESGVYLHGLPYFIAPDAQKHIASFMWFGKGQRFVDINRLNSLSQNKYSHDNLFDTLLGLFNVETKIYNKDKDILYKAKPDQ